MEEWSGSYEADLSFWVIPYWELLLALMAFLMTFGVTYFKSHRLEKFKLSCVPYVSPVDENLTMIATRAGCKNWKLLAKINKLKFPFMVARGQTILAPKNMAAPAPAPTPVAPQPVQPVQPAPTPAPTPVPPNNPTPNQPPNANPSQQ